MSDNIYLVDIGLAEDTVVYELVPREVARLKGYNLQGVIETLKSFGARSLVVDTPDDRIADEMRVNGLAVASDLPVPLIVAEAKCG
jgi:hypothetical protein